MEGICSHAAHLKLHKLHLNFIFYRSEYGQFDCLFTSRCPSKFMNVTMWEQFGILEIVQVTTLTQFCWFENVLPTYSGIEQNDVITPVTS
jgi:hypothetical protein